MVSPNAYIELFMYPNFNNTRHLKQLLKNSH